ncbi:MAG: DUF2147 domain-containing protein [Hyphomicrobium sp.]
MTSNRHIAAFSALLGAALSAASPAAAGLRETGIWYDDTGRGAVKIEQCGNKLCGKIYWLKELVNAEGKPLIDRHNPNEAQRNRPICGLQVFGGVTKMQDGDWDAGWIYDPKEGKSYSVAMVMEDNDTLKVTGYLVMKLMGRTLTWKRAPADLPHCAQNAAAPAGNGAGNGAGTGAAAGAAAGTAGSGAAKASEAGDPAPKAPTAKASKVGGVVPPPSAVAPAKTSPAKLAPAKTDSQKSGPDSAASKAKAGQAKAGMTVAKTPAHKGSPANNSSKAQPVSQSTGEVLPWASTKTVKKKAPAAASKTTTEANKPGASKVDAP